jgi:transcriptional regulator with XRE-family HTH domain
VTIEPDLNVRDGEGPTPAQLGRVVRILRVRGEMTIETLAKASGLHWTYVSGIERGRRNPTLKVLVALSRALGVTTSELIELAEDAENQARKV